MRKIVFLIHVGLALFIISCTCNFKGEEVRVKSNFDNNWFFYLGDLPNGSDSGLDHSTWRNINLPHDWSIEGEYSQDHGTDWQSGYLPAGIGWYRKSFPYNSEWKDKKIYIMFDGIYMNSDVWINGHHLGNRPFGYISFYYDLTEYLNEGENILAVKVDHSKPLSGRWYTGSGIYRHVWLEVMDNLHVDIWGTYFTATDISDKSASIAVTSTVCNESHAERDVIITNYIIDKDNKTISCLSGEINIKAGEKEEITFSGEVKNPELWSPENPYLYTLKTVIRNGEKIVDTYTQRVGIRKIEFSPEFGFKLNDKVTKLKGVCMHHEAGPVGTAVPDDVLRRRLNILKNMGCNAIRTSHNPFAPEFYDLCDEIGFLVMNEFTDGWEQEKAKHDYGNYFEAWWKKDAKDFILRDRNHASVIIWSIGNEVAKPTRETQKELIDFFHKHDPTRPVTQGGHDPTRGMTGEKLPTQLDIKGFNGDGEEKGVFEKHHKKHPNEPMIGTEVPHTYQTRGVYRSLTHWRRRDFPAMWEIKGGTAGTMKGLEGRVYEIPDLSDKEVFPEEKQTTYYKDGKTYKIKITDHWQPNLYYQSSYDNASVRSSARKAWQRTRDLPYVMGQFRWTAFDYLGETNQWPSRFANFGIIDICGFPKDHFYLYKSMWTEDPMVHILPHWTHKGKEGVEVPVVAYTNCESVELFLNNKSLGEQKYNDEQLVWQVKYEPGVLKAVAKKNNEIVAEVKQITAGKPAMIKLKPDKVNIDANNTDVVHVELDITDKNGVMHPYADHLVEFTVEGPAKTIGIDNGDPLDLSAYKVNTRRAFRGKCLLILQATTGEGLIEVTAKSKGLKDDKVTIKSTK